jgi:polyisoprenoid-binding protein YceI
MRWVVVPEASTVWIEGTSSVHPIRASATGVTGWLDSAFTGGAFAVDGDVSGHVEIAIEQLSSGNPLIDRETRRRANAKRYPLITGDVQTARIVSDLELVVEGVIGFRGEEVAVEGSLHLVDASSENMVIEGNAVFDVRWWQLRPPRIGLLRVHPNIEVAIRLVFASSA